MQSNLFAPKEKERRQNPIPWTLTIGVLCVTVVAVVGSGLSARRQQKQITEMEAALNQAGLDLIDAGRSEAALGAFEQMLKLNPSNVYALNNRSIALYQLGRYDEARKSAEDAMRFMPDCAVAKANKDRAMRGGESDSPRPSSP